MNSRYIFASLFRKPGYRRIWEEQECIRTSYGSLTDVTNSNIISTAGRCFSQINLQRYSSAPKCFVLSLRPNLQHLTKATYLPTRSLPEWGWLGLAAFECAGAGVCGPLVRAILGVKILYARVQHEYSTVFSCTVAY